VDPCPDLRVQFAKRADGSVVLRCTRADGSVTWQRHDGRQALFFPFHDLTHFAVESTLGFRQGFYGLVADGWEIADTGGKGARGRLPDETVLVEHIVGLLDRERVGGAMPMSAREVNAQLGRLAEDGRVAHPPTLTDAQIDEVRRRVDALHDEWAAVAPGGTLELCFARDGAARESDR
jgi:hypothetical protein